MAEITRETFWIWSNNLTPTLLILANLISYDLLQEEIDAIKFGLEGTPDIKNEWYNYKFLNHQLLSLDIAFDEDNADIIFIRLSYDKELQVAMNTVIYVVTNFNVNERHSYQNA
jgi:hypothetical protein